MSEVSTQDVKAISTFPIQFLDATRYTCRCGNRVTAHINQELDTQKRYDSHLAGDGVNTSIRCCEYSGEPIILQASA